MLSKDMDGRGGARVSAVRYLSLSYIRYNAKNASGEPKRVMNIYDISILVEKGGGFMIKNMKCSWSAKHSKWLLIVLRLR